MLNFVIVNVLNLISQIPDKTIEKWKTRKYKQLQFDFNELCYGHLRSMVQIGALKSSLYVANHIDYPKNI